MKKFVLLLLVLCLFVTGCSLNNPTTNTVTRMYKTNAGSFQVDLITKKNGEKKITVVNMGENKKYSGTISDEDYNCISNVLDNAENNTGIFSNYKKEDIDPFLVEMFLNLAKSVNDSTQDKETYLKNYNSCIDITNIESRKDLPKTLPGQNSMPLFEDGMKKPVIYLYGYDEEVNVQLGLADTYFTCTYPEYKENGWTVKASPDGQLKDKDGKIYRYLYWEGAGSTLGNINKGYCVCGKYTSDFLEVKLKELGLNNDEINEFIIYWLPQMENNPYNVISFDTEKYERQARLNINPAPDSIIRVFMTWYPSDEVVDIEAPIIKTPQRRGKTVVEWGGCKLNNIR